MDVKGAFDHFSQVELTQGMFDLGINDDLIGQT